MKILSYVPTLVMLVFAGTFHAQAAAMEKIRLQPGNCQLVVPAQTNPIIEYAVDELNHHLKLVFGTRVAVAEKPVPGKYHIYVGIRQEQDQDQDPFVDEEARYIVCSDAIWLYGKDVCSKTPDGNSGMEAALLADNQAGTLFAVYEFLENRLGIRWLEPGENGIVYKKLDVVELVPGQGRWTPKLVQRHMRSAYKDNTRQRYLSRGNVPEEMRFTEAEFLKRRNDEIIWKRRMRMGRSRKIAHGSPFAQWWYKYGKTHPEYFALNPNGSRAPGSARNASKINICVSNPDVVREVVKQHIANGNADFILNSDNNSHGFCNCENCKALDAETPEEKHMPFEARSKSDRYVHFTNALLREARKSNPNIKAAYYAYSRFHQAPRREKMDEAIITLMIPNLGLTFKESGEFFDAWKQAGASEAYMRPNDLNQDTGLPLGFERHMFTKYKQSFDYLNMTGTDYDACQGLWPVTGIANYIMARGFYRPERSFEDWESEYCQSFGPAAEDVRRYYRYWRQIWEQRIMKNQERIGEMAPIKLLRTRIMFVTDLLYSEKDFDTTDTFLRNGLKKQNLSTGEKNRLERLLLANEHNRLKYRAMVANIPTSTASEKQRQAATQALYDFRCEHRMDLNMHWELLFYLENLHEDNAGFKRLFGTEDSRQRNYRQEVSNKMSAARDDNKPLR